jgi:transposase
VFVADPSSLRLVPDELWALAEPLMPKFRPRPQGESTAPLDDRVVFTAIVYVLTSGCAWRDLPPSFGVPFQTAHHRSGNGPGQGYAGGCTERCWMNWGRAASWTGHR